MLGNTHVLLWTKIGEYQLTLFDKEELVLAWKKLRSLPTGGGIEVCHEILGTHSVRAKPILNLLFNILEGSDPETSPFILLGDDKAKEVALIMEEVLPEEDSGLGFKLVWNGSELRLFAYSTDTDQYWLLRLAPPWDDALGQIFTSSL